MSAQYFEKLSLFSKVFSSNFNNSTIFTVVPSIFISFLDLILESETRSQSNTESKLVLFGQLTIEFDSLKTIRKRFFLDR